MDHDDVFSPILGRRDILRTAGALGILEMLRRAAPSLGTGTALAAPGDVDFSDLLDNPALQGVCTLTPSQTSGPFYFDTGLVRSDITEGRPGIPTRLAIHVVRASDCSPIPNAAVDVWHAEAIAGRYSGYASQGTAGQTFLRGIQFTDANGTVLFDTIYPGWYPGRTAHIHLKVRPTGSSELTTQMYFKQRLTNRVYTLPPYTMHAGTPTTNQQDNLYNAATQMTILSASGGQLILEFTAAVAG